MHYKRTIATIATSGFLYSTLTNLARLDRSDTINFNETTEFWVGLLEEFIAIPAGWILIGSMFLFFLHLYRIQQDTEFKTLIHTYGKVLLIIIGGYTILLLLGNEVGVFRRYFPFQLLYFFTLLAIIGSTATIPLEMEPDNQAAERLKNALFTFPVAVVLFSVIGFVDYTIYPTYYLNQSAILPIPIFLSAIYILHQLSNYREFKDKSERNYNLLYRQAENTEFEDYENSN